MKTIYTLAIIVSLSCVLSSTAFASTTHTAAYENGYAAGLRNDTITTACISYQGTAKWNDCDNGFNNGGAALQKTTSEYQYGFQVAKNDSVIALYDSSDACANYKQDYAKTSCKNGYGTGYDNKLLNTVNSIVQKYRESMPFKRGFANGAVNGNVTEACKNFSKRDLALCQNAYYYGKDPLGISPIHCSDIDTNPNSCYTLGHDAGYSSAEKEIIRCHLISIPPTSGHTPRFEAGFHTGWLQANTKAIRPDHTYGKNCTKYY
jgi:hypothetical protein